MKAAEYWSWSLKSARDAMARGDVSPVDMVLSVLDRIARRSQLNAYITVLTEQALAEAEECQRSLERGETPGLLFGVPIALKDNIAAAKSRTTAGSPLRERWIPDADADVLKALRAAGAILIGKNNLFEFAYGAAHPHFGETLNPWQQNLTCGGSSSGSAAAVADGEAFGAVGSDTGGSIRIPAAMCGIVGLKPTRGRISNRGVIPVSGALDVIGPMTRSVEDARLMFAAMAGSGESRAAGGETAVIGILDDSPLGRLPGPVADALDGARRRFERQGYAVKTVAFPDLDLALEVMWTIASADAAEYHREDLRSRPGDYCDEVRRNLVGGAMVPAADYIRAQRLRARLAAETEAVFANVEAVLLPSMAALPYPSGLQRVVVDGVETGVLPLIMGFTPLANLTGHPAIVVPVESSADGIPLTVQLYGRRGADERLCEIAQMIERPTVPLPAR
jgi:aspartyl-tRNA(Asn)/glutamyl-tRNA(Gln) amidotransferase subunit A